MAVMYVQGLVIAYMIFQIIRKLFFGELRAAEYEHLSERTWHAIMETCLAFTVFRDDFSPRFVMQFVFLLFIKLFHWLSEDRVDFMERSPIITILFHCRMMSLLAFLSALDSYFISHAYFTTLVHGASVQIVFGFEYAVLMTIVLHVTIKYILHMHDLRNVHPWENKAVYLLYSELLINCLRCILYVIFVAIMIRLHTFPLFSIRPLYLTIRAFHKAVNDVILSRRAIHAMNNLFPLATEQDLMQGDNTCIICREEMTPISGAKKLPCNHIFHPNCLRSWFQRQQSCPTCRTDILAQRRTAPTAAAAGAAAAAAAGPAQGQQNIGGIQPANNEGEIPNMFPFMAQFAFPRQPQQQQQQQQQQPQAGTNTTGQQNVNGTSIPQMPPPTAGFNMPQFPTVPPPGFPFMAIPPFAMPPVFPFPPVPSFAGLTDEEVAAMEGTERQAVEARINCIRNIGLLLDAATMQLQQYMSIVQSLSAPTYTPAATNANATQLPNDATFSGTSAASSTTAENSVHDSSKSVARSDTPIAANSDKAKSDKNPASSAIDSTSPTCSSTPTTGLDEIRQRRLQKFGPTTASLSDNSND
ncbi:E3 ubiquitin-protein ligase synoviolin [Dirofilaria immitis]